MGRHIFMTFSQKNLPFLTSATVESQALKNLLNLLVKLDIIDGEITVAYGTQFGTLKHVK